ncbi:hypothetical protein C8R43DRAFT_1027566 [Mycena crocata]|nr:hypothetical protein C8R43DRAFT_1027566 [Mycena crocata]
MTALDELFGALLLGTWAASFLTGIVAAEAHKYFTAFPNDPWRRRGLVILTLCLCVAALIGDYANTYLPTVTYWGNIEAIAQVYWPLPLYSVMNTLLAFIVESVLIYRFYVLSKNIWATLFLYSLVLLAIAGYLIGFIPLVRGSTYADRDKAKLGALINFIAFAVCDVLTAAGLIWKLRSMRTSIRDTRTFINRLIVGAVQTGSATSLCSISLQVTFHYSPETNLATFFIYLFAPLYTLTLLFNFNLRQNAWAGTDETDESLGGINGVVSTGMPLFIGVQHTTLVTMDPTRSEAAAERRRTDGGHSVERNSDTESFGTRKATTLSGN